MHISRFRLAAEQRLPSAELNWGVMLLAGRGVAKDLALGISMLQRAAEQGDKDAMFRLAKFGACA